MKPYFKKILLVLMLSTFGLSSHATHYLGGEIYWECLENGNFRFILKVYRECGGINYPTTGITLNSNSPAGDIPLRLWPDEVQGIKDISPQCNTDPIFSRIKCINASPSQPSNQGAVEEWTFTSDLLYPNGITLNGIPPPTGWVFSYKSCCRNAASNYSGNPGWFLRAIMYPYYNKSTFPCWDDSPVFQSQAPSVLCAGYPYHYNHWANDKQGDSLVFAWNTPLINDLSSPIITWNSGYSYLSPFPDLLHNPNNLPATVHPDLGSISLTSYTAGAFITCLSATAYRSGVKIAEVFREIQVAVIPCAPNTPPDVRFPGSQVNPYFFVDTFFIGDHVSSFITAKDSFLLFLPNGQMTTVTSNAFSTQFGTGFTSDTCGCMIPPCATLDPPAPISGQPGISHQLNWDITADHYWGDSLKCPSRKGIYDFFFRVSDDFCPIPGENLYIYRIVVRPNPLQINNYQNEQAFIVTYEPLHHRLVFQMKKPPSGMAEVRLFNMMGQAVESGFSRSNEDRVALSTHGLQSGVYVYSIIQQGSRIQSGKVAILE